MNGEIVCVTERESRARWKIKQFLNAVFEIQLVHECDSVCGKPIPAVGASRNREAEAALEKERIDNKLVLFPIRLHDAVMDTQQARAASLRRTRHIGGFPNWKDHDAYKGAFGRLLRDLKADSTVASND